MYLQEEPTVELFRDFFHLNYRTELGPILNLVASPFRKGRMLVSLTPNFTVPLRIGTRLGSIVRILPLKMRILCRVTVLTGLPTHIHFRNG